MRRTVAPPATDPTLEPAPPRARGAAIVPVVPEVAELLAAAERVLVTCGDVDRERGERAVALASALDPVLAPPLALMGPDLPSPLADRVALRALRRLALALHPSVPGALGGWRTPGGARVVEFRAVVVDARDLTLLADAAARLSHPRRSREGALRRVRERLAAGAGEPPAERHPDALGCLLAAILTPDDPDTLAVHRLASRSGRDGPVLDERALAAHRAVAARILRRL